MTGERARGLGPAEYATYLVTGLIGNVMFVWPGHVVRAAGESAVASVAGSIGVIFASGLLFHLAVRRLDPANRAARLFITGLAGAGLLLIAAVDTGLAALLTQMLQTMFYADTPRWALLIPFLATTLWAGGISLAGLGRLTQLWMPLGGLVLGSVAAVGLIHATHVRPLFPERLYAMPIMHGVGIMAYLFLPIGPMVLILLPHINASAQSSRRAYYVAATVTGFSLLAIYVLVTMMLGPQAIRLLHWPLVFSLQTITLDSTFFISRMGLAVIFLWTAVAVLAFAVHLRITVEVLTPRANAASVWLVLSVGMVYGIGLVTFPTPTASTQWIVNDVDPVAVIYLILAHAAVGVWMAIDAILRRRRTLGTGRPANGPPT